jgi:copper homeostasis protein
MVEYARSKKLRIAAMIRSRNGFTLQSGDISRLRKDIQVMSAAGVEGLVFGFLTPEGGIDFAAVEKLLEEIYSQEARYGRKEKVFHMAFDELAEAEQFAALDALHERGFDRILTKGGAGRAEDNQDRLKALHQYAQGRITILCGGGVTGENYQRIAEYTGITEFHGRRLSRR